MNSENGKTSHPHRLLLNLTDKINLNRSDKYVALSNLSIYYTWKNIKKSYQKKKKKKIKISTPTWNEEFELRDGSYSVSNMQDYFKYIFEKHETVTSIRIFGNKKIENRVTFNIKTRYYIELLMPETLKLLGSPKSKITKKGNGEYVPHLEITEVVLVHCNIVNNNYQ